MPVIKFGTELHKTVLQGLMARVELSEKAIEKKTGMWDKAEKDFVFEVQETKNDTLRRTSRDNGVPQYTTINIPYSYAQMMTAHTYLASVFLSRNPILQFGARHGEPEMNVQAVEAIMDYQTQVGGHLGPYFVWLHDSLMYGVGVVGTFWEKEAHTVSDVQQEPVTLGGSPIPGKFREVKTTRVIEGYEGNRLFNIRPYDYLPDPRVPMGQPQKGEFGGRKVPIGFNTIMKRKIAKQYFNIEVVEKRLKPFSGGTDDSRASVVTELELPDSFEGGGALHTPSALVGTLPGIELVVELIPKLWKLGSTEEPEKWVFTILDRKIIVEARPFGRWHNKFPFEVIESEVEGYAFVKRGMFEIGRPLNDVMTWLFNSHFYAVRKSLNGDIVYDPSKIVGTDLNNSSGTGSRIRIKPQAYGQDIRAMIHTLQGGADVTGTHLRDTDVVGALLQRVTGVNDNISGAINPGGRKTATEIRTASSASINRLRTMAEYMSANGFSTLSQQLLQTTQQMYRAEKKFKIVGDLAWNPGTPGVPGQNEPQDGFMVVDPNAISGFYDFTPVDGTLPIDRFAIVNMWANLFAQIKQFPQIQAEYNISDIFAWVAQLAGIKNIKQFKINVVPPGALGGASGGIGTGAPGAQSGGPASGGGDGGPVVQLPRQVPGVGRSG